MAETPVHRDDLMRQIQTLQDAFAGRPDVYVSGNMMFYYEEGNPRASVSPDVFVVVGVPKLPERRVYKLWEERAPAVVIEITSRSTRRTDFGRKRDLYARIGVREYYLYDPLAEYLRPPLQGYRLEDGAYVPIAPDADGGLRSEALGLRLLLVEGRLRYQDPATGRLLPSPADRADTFAAVLADMRATIDALTAALGDNQATIDALSAALRDTQARADDEAAARRAADARIAELEARRAPRDEEA